MGRELQDNYHTFFIGRLRWSYFSSYYDATVELRFNEVPRDCENLFVISRVRYIENLDLRNCLVSLEAVFGCHATLPQKNVVHSFLQSKQCHSIYFEKEVAISSFLAICHFLSFFERHISNLSFGLTWNTPGSLSRTLPREATSLSGVCSSVRRLKSRLRFGCEVIIFFSWP